MSPEAGPSDWYTEAPGQLSLTLGAGKVTTAPALLVAVVVMLAGRPSIFGDVTSRTVTRKFVVASGDTPLVAVAVTPAVGTASP